MIANERATRNEPSRNQRSGLALIDNAKISIVVLVGRINAREVSPITRTIRVRIFASKDFPAISVSPRLLCSAPSFKL